MADAHLRSLKVCMAAMAWVGLLLAATHDSDKPVVLGRYSESYAYLLCLFFGIAVTLSLARSTWYLALYQVRGGFVISGVSLLLSLGVLELGVRMVDPLGISYYELAGDYVRDKLADDQLVFKHKPSWDTRYGDVLVTYNEQGLRDRPILPKAPGEYRILALGDSVTFGWGVAQDKTFAVRLELLLQERLHQAVRVINSGVGGYNTVQEVAYFKREGLTFNPDLVLLTYVQNDIEQNKGPFDPWTESSVWRKPVPDMLKTLVGKLWIYRLAYHAYNYAWPQHAKGQVNAPVQVGEGWRQSMAALRELVVMCESRHLPLIIFFKRMDPSEKQSLFEDVVRQAQGILVKDTAPWFEGLNVFALVNSKVDGHPNAEGHRILAEHMADDITSYLKAPPN